MKTGKKKLKKLALEKQIDVMAMRRVFHQRPDLRWDEDETLRGIEQICNKITLGDSLSMRMQYFEGGLIVDIDVLPLTDNNLDRILFRADVDAIPVQEETGLEFSSKFNWASHACGHDAHIAMLLGAAQIICSGKVQLKHNIRLVFQRAEENPGSPPFKVSGGRILVEEGVCDDISHVYGLHITSSSESGVFRCREGAILANSDRLEVIIKTSGGHVALPKEGVNAIRVAHRVQNFLMGYDNTTTPFEPSVSISGTKKATNIMPSKAELYFGARNFLPDKEREEMFQQVTLGIGSIAKEFPRTEIQVNPIFGHPAASNNSESVQYAESLITQAGETVAEQEPLAAGDDFAYYLRKCPGSYWVLDAHKPGAGSHHSPTFDINEDVLWKGVLFWLLLATN